jgi:hypothetical protein
MTALLVARETWPPPAASPLRIKKRAPWRAFVPRRFFWRLGMFWVLGCSGWLLVLETPGRGERPFSTRTQLCFCFFVLCAVALVCPVRRQLPKGSAPEVYPAVG